MLVACNLKFFLKNYVLKVGWKAALPVTNFRLKILHSRQNLLLRDYPILLKIHLFKKLVWLNN